MVLENSLVQEEEEEEAMGVDLHCHRGHREEEEEEVEDSRDSSRGVHPIVALGRKLS